MPIIEAVAGSLGLLSAVEAFVSTPLSPAMQAWGYGAGREARNIIPSPNAIFSAYLRGFISQETASKQLSYNGVNWDVSEVDGFSELNRKTWDAVLESARPLLDPSTVGEMYLRGLVKGDDYKRLWCLTGAKKENWIDLLRSKVYRMTPGELILASNRGLVSIEEFRKRLRRCGVVSGHERWEYERLRSQLPPISDLIRFMVKEAFDEDVVKKLGYDKEYPEEIMEAVASAQGFRKFSDAMEGVPAGFDISYARAAWRSHWTPISPTQAYEMLHRIREPFAWKDEEGEHTEEPFTERDVKRWLKIADYPSAIRPYLVKLSYRVFTLRDIKRLFTLKKISPEQAIGYYQDLGYEEGKAKILLGGLEKEVDATRVRRESIKVETQILSGYDLGWIDRPDANQRLVDIFSVVENPVVAPGLAKMALDAVDLRRETRLIKLTVSAIRADFLEGAIEEEIALAALRTAGIFNDRASQLVQLWKIQLSRPRRTEAANKIITYYKQSLIDAREVYTRLMRIGFSDRDARLRLASADQELFKGSEYSEGKPPGKPSSQKYSTSVPRLRNWFINGVIDEDAARSRLTGLGWPSGDVDREIALWTLDKQEPTNGQQEPLEDSPIS